MGKNLIAVSAKIGGGKDTFFDILKNKTGKHYENKKFAWKLKEIAEKLTGIPALDFEKENVKNSYLPEEWNYTDTNGVTQRMTCREFMQKMGTEGMRNGVHTNVWVNSLFADYKPILSYAQARMNVGKMPTDKMYSEGDLPNWFISDCRFPNEAESIKKRGGLIIRINRNYTWEQFCKLYGVVGLDNPSNNSDKKESALTWGNFLKTSEQTENVRGAVNKVFHSSETSLDNYAEFDYVINNDGTLEDFTNEIEKCLLSLQILENEQSFV